MDPISLHHFATHFPVALVYLALVFDLWSVFRSKTGETRLGPVNTFPVFLIMALMAVVSIGTGLWAESTLATSPLRAELIEHHETLALFSVAAIVILTLWRIALRGTLPAKHRWYYLLGVLATVVIVSWTAIAGHHVVTVTH